MCLELARHIRIHCIRFIFSKFWVTIMGSLLIMGSLTQIAIFDTCAWGTCPRNAVREYFKRRDEDSSDVVGVKRWWLTLASP